MKANKVRLISTCTVTGGLFYKSISLISPGANYLDTNIQTHPNWTTRFFASKDIIEDQRKREVSIIVARKHAVLTTKLEEESDDITNGRYPRNPTL